MPATGTSDESDRKVVSSVKAGKSRQRKAGAAPSLSRQDTVEGSRTEPLPDARIDIVSSAHLVSPKSPQLSEFEFGIIIAWNAFSRWMVRCMSAAGVKDMTPVDVLVLHHVNHRSSEKRIADIGFALNIEDIYVVNYSLKKLAAAGLVRSAKQGKEVFFKTTAAGSDLCMKYRTVRESCLMPGFSGAEGENTSLEELARTLRTLSGRYDQAARAATVF